MSSGDRLKQLMLIGALLAITSPVYALTVQDQPIMTPDTLPLPPAKEGALAWHVLAKTKEKPTRVEYPDGGYSFNVTPVFPEDVKALDGKKIRLHGFMFPLEQSKKQSNFLFGPYPPSCPFHYHVGPALVVEVRSQKPIEFSWDELELEGTFRLKPKAEEGVFYVLEGAAVR